MSKSLSYLAALALAASPAFAGDTSTTSSTKQVAAEVVSADKQMKTITVKTGPTATAGSKTLVAKVDAKAVSVLDTVKSGDKVTLTCLAEKDRDCDTVTNITKTSEQ
jgi:hypothetical protein